MRSLLDLLDETDSALPLLRTWIDDPAGNGGVLLPPDQRMRIETLTGLQVTTRSMLGAIAYETGGVAVADGFLRLLGGGLVRSLPQTAALTGAPLDGSYPDVIVVADDVLGGLFALNGGRFGAGRPGEVFHLAADDIAWAPLGVGYADFVEWCLTGDLKQLYEPFAHLDEYEARPRPAFDEAYAFYPFLWSREAREGRPSVSVVSAAESLRLRLDFCGFTVG
ncbi:DUF2625 family protein [Caulobacter endophyticus]|uniref:DUF2625 family protein n=1 Tax=Caulobacter endophyticus TaxID=2172652 RepID=UPI002410A792|nr:DUF2625 family protein [Caulobacter endophyticus]MDG2531076.1 DUF2625 family protein [Caulobacter endophyticus]